MLKGPIPHPELIAPVISEFSLQNWATLQTAIK
jgi:hypothetical protein